MADDEWDDEDQPARPPFADLPPPPPDVVPSGEVYDWYQRGVTLLQNGDLHAAVEVLSRASSAVPDSRSVLEALARAQFDAGMFAEAKVSFEKIVAVNPADDYAQFGLGLAAARVDDLDTAIEHLALAAAMRPDIAYYATALRGARATKAARR
ncbi:MAG TPA: tetratricopeptide repeat protein [Mycobacteriales bacterium]|jgi:tetratricopeptide (TPR) repeat protein|nr:tetratricopeptide repeat protein [Mycobacteriales bacterium]